MSWLDTYKTGSTKKKTSWLDTFRGGTDFLARTDKANTNKLKELMAEGKLKQFEDYQKGPTLPERAWEGLKSTGSNVMDVLQRGEYATSAATEKFIHDRPVSEIARAAGREIFSGVGDIKGEKKPIPELIKQYSPGYEEFAEEHPVASMGTDMALSVGLDPTTYIPGAAFGKIARGGKKVAGKLTKPLTKTKTAEKIAGTLGRTFDTSYLWKKGAGKVAGTKGYDILWSEGKFASAMRKKLQKGIEPHIETITTWEPEKIKNFIKVMYGDVDVIPISEDVKQVAIALKTQLRHIGSRESKYAGKGLDWMLEDYFPNNPRQLTELMENIGEYLPSGHNRGLALWKTTPERQKVIRTGDDFLNWLGKVGVSDDNLAEVVTRNLMGRASGSANKIRNIRMTHKLVRDLPDVFEEVPLGTKKVWNLSKEGLPIVQPGNTLWMPSGNLRMFPQKIIKQNKEIREALELGKGIELTGEMLKDLSKQMVGVTTRVKAYSVPREIIEDITKVSTRLGNPGTILEWYDKMMNVFKNTAILSPFFHMRNFISSGSQNYLADINPDRYADAIKVFKNWKTNPNKIIKGKSAAGWHNLFDRHSITGGSFIGQQTGKTGIPVAESVFKLNRQIGTGVENISRAPLFMDRILKGDSFLDAAKKVKHFHFDYSELTDTERTVFKRLAPFYSWTRHNVPLQLEMILKAPKKYRNIAKLKQSVLGGKGSEYVPDWWKEQDVWETKFQDKEGNKMAIMVGLPYSDLNDILTNPTGSLGPAGAAASLAMNYDPFYESKIKEFPGQKKPFVQIGNKTLKVNPKFIYGIEHVIPAIKRYGTDLSKEISMLATGTEKPDTFYKALSKIIGIRILPLTKDKQEKKRIYDLLRDLNDYRQYLNQGN